MKFRSLLPWRATAGRNLVRERKAASGFMSLTAEGKANWTGRSYAGLSREGFMRNPVAHRCVRLVSEATASVPLRLYDGDRERPDHPLLSLLRQPHGHMGGPDFFEAFYGHLLLSGNACGGNPATTRPCREKTLSPLIPVTSTGMRGDREEVSAGTSIIPAYRMPVRLFPVAERERQAQRLPRRGRPSQSR